MWEYAISLKLASLRETIATKIDQIWTALFTTFSIWTFSSKDRWARWFYTSGKTHRFLLSYEIEPFYYHLGLRFGIDLRSGDNNCLCIGFCIPLIIAVWIHFGWIQPKKSGKYGFTLDHHHISWLWGEVNDPTWCATNKKTRWSFYWNQLVLLDVINKVILSDNKRVITVQAQPGIVPTKHVAHIQLVEVILLYKLGCFQWRSSYTGWNINFKNPSPQTPELILIVNDELRSVNDVVKYYTDNFLESQHNVG